ncbi:MAG TPA: class I SAM-dependent methyltransferase [Thermoanaerobaculia bacterium]|nr:class I SAM-dependent methyltransferase [Thermoanaerobaculia bacterium]
MHCPVCDSAELAPFASRGRIAEELAVRREFFAARIDGAIDWSGMKDRFDVLHNTATAIRICEACKVLVREDDCREFESDPYPAYLMERMLRAQIDAYRAKGHWLRPMLPAGANVVEVGSYVGAFLHVAHEWGWTAMGVDVGEDTARFAAAHSYPTRQASLESCGFETSSFDAVFIWNTFEQVDDPRSLLKESRRIARAGGLLAIRTPNASFYATEHDLETLAWSNLLGFPHRYGFTRAALARLANECGFALIECRDDVYMPTMRERFNALARKEEDDVTRALRESGRAPWIECLYRAQA